MFKDMIKSLAEAGCLKGSGQGSTERGVMESKAWFDVDKLGSDRAGYRTWNEKFKNALAQAVLGGR